mmetsp:Transcript_77605/g.179961  ORF Transcript_77605/g.179961 Transcript_77605/m.179961 type:complete len:235 (+) Transcript_77605:1621-2325(+)
MYNSRSAFACPTCGTSECGTRTAGCMAEALSANSIESCAWSSATPLFAPASRFDASPEGVSCTRPGTSRITRMRNVPPELACTAGCTTKPALIEARNEDSMPMLRGAPLVQSSSKAESPGGHSTSSKTPRLLCCTPWPTTAAALHPVFPTVESMAPARALDAALTNGTPASSSIAAAVAPSSGTLLLCASVAANGGVLRPLWDASSDARRSNSAALDGFPRSASGSSNASSGTW